MNTFQTIGALLTVAAVGSYINHRFFKLPTTIGLMALTLSISLVLVLLGQLGVVRIQDAAALVTSIDFGDVLLHGMLAFLLFAGALHVNLDDLKNARWPVAVLSTVGVLLATFITGGLFWLVAGWLGFNLPFVYALLFGALIAPTDPIAVMGIIKKVGAPKALETKIAGESLFNDGMAVVVFLTILGIVTGKSEPAVTYVTLFLLEETVGGAVLGGILGWGAYQLLRSVDNYQVEVLLTLALVAGGYAFAEFVHVSAPIAMVVAGLLIGNHGRAFAMSDKTREHLDDFWELVDEVLNAVLFVLIGMEIIVLSLAVPHLVAGLAAIVVVLFARFVSVALPVQLMAIKRAFAKGTIKVLTWGGLRGGISIALALSLPAGPERELILTATYMVVIFSVLVQGLTFGRLIESLESGKTAKRAPASTGKKPRQSAGAARRAS